MAQWQRSFRDQLFVLLIAVLVTSIVALAITALWPLLSIVAHWGPVFWASVAALGLGCIALYARHRRAREADTLAVVDTSSFAQAVVRMRASEVDPGLSSHSAARRSMTAARTSDGYQAGAVGRGA